MNWNEAIQELQAREFETRPDDQKCICGQANLSAFERVGKLARDLIAAPTPDNNGCDEFVTVRKKDLCKAAACLMIPNNGVEDTVWFENGTTLFEHLVGLAGIDDLTADVEADYMLLSGKPWPLPPPPALDKKGGG